MIKAIMFDLWDTLFFDDVKPKPLDKFAQKLGKNFEDYNFLKTFERNLMTKRHKDFKIPIKGILKEIKIKYDEKLFKELNDIMKKSDKNQKPFPETLKVIEKLKKRYKIVLISNVSYPAYRNLKSKYSLNKYFDLILASYQTKILKPDLRIFKFALKKLDIKKQEAIMVGDNMKDDVISAQKFGISAILIDRKNKYPNFKRRITSLNEIFNFLK
jgi:putative hydrolase of the HAD superfamily